MKQIFLPVFIIALCASVFNGCSRDEQSATAHPQRIISLAPSITETLFALGLDDRIVGITYHCRYPVQTERIEKVGGYADANIEKILSLKPDVVMMTGDHEMYRVHLQRFGINTLMVNDNSTAAVCSMFSAIGTVSGVENVSDSLIRLFDKKMTKTIHDVSFPPKVLICVGRDSPGGGRIGSIFAAGKNTFYNELIEASGGVNAFAENAPSYPRLSIEGIMSLAPDIIIDIAPSMEHTSCSLLVEDWYSLDRVPAVRNRNVFCLPADYATIPGPRMLLLLEDIRETVGRFRESL